MTVNSDDESKEAAECGKKLLRPRNLRCRAQIRMDLKFEHALYLVTPSKVATTLVALVESSRHR